MLAGEIDVAANCICKGLLFAGGQFLRKISWIQRNHASNQFALVEGLARREVSND